MEQQNKLTEEEKAYQALRTQDMQDMPDLWSRIDTGFEEEVTKQQAARKKRRTRQFVLVAAAILIVIIAADGICHIYVDKDADIGKAIPIILDAKTQYVSACNTVETLLVHKDIAKELVPKLADRLQIFCSL